MNLEIADEEARELRIALDIRLREMRNELVHTDDHAYRADLRRSLERLEKIAQKVGGSGPG
ncbi:hypothetical protein [Polyangium jinanense]|uniref:Uncharacterized protein n=1 Tax=Polyangium jinanense TaxID=2829994 RepID=A0A9X3X6A0_9BACT|nr:hypothetical protein [Polyangium jinanense]MDC3956167.1 hypothetical protein [Polyangium jinanense]MDC3982998.1 hypothetical protein [Polyangium jinanense]